MKQLTTAVCTLVLLGAFEIRAQVPQVLGVWDLDVAGSSLPAQAFRWGSSPRFAILSCGMTAIWSLWLSG